MVDVAMIVAGPTHRRFPQASNPPFNEQLEIDRARGVLPKQ